MLTTAFAETSLPLARLTGEKARTIGQWRGYAKAVSTGIYTEARIDLPQASNQNQICVNTMLAWVLLFFWSQQFSVCIFYSWRRYCQCYWSRLPCYCKAHPAHPETSQIMADAITEVVKEFGWPEGVFSHITRKSNILVAYLIQHKEIKAAAFTGSFQEERHCLI